MAGELAGRVPGVLRSRPAALVILYNALLLAWILLAPAPRGVVVAVDEVAQFLGPLLILPLCFRPDTLPWRHATAASSTRRAALQWACTLLGLSIFCFILGQINWAYNEEVLHRTVFPSWSDVLYLAIPPLVLLSILLLPPPSLSLARRALLLLDGLMIIIAVAACSWYFILAPTLEATTISVPARIVGAAYPIGDLVTICCLLLLRAQGGGDISRPVLRPLGLALGLFVLTSSVYEYRTLHGTSATGSVLDVGWPLSFMILGLAAGALRQLPAGTSSMDRPPPGRVEVPSLWHTALPYISLLLLGSLAVVAWRTHAEVGRAQGIYGGGLLLVALVVARQVLTSLDNRRLYHRLNDAYALQGEGLAQRVAELEWLRDLSRQVNEAGTLDEVLEVTYGGVRAGLNYDRVGIALYTEATGVFEDRVGTDTEGNKIRPCDRLVHISAEEAPARFPCLATLLRGADLFFTTAAYDEWPPDLRYLLDGRPTHNLVVPLRTGTTLLGMISVDNLLSGRPILPREAGPLQALANQVAVAVARARAMDALQHQALHDVLTGLPNRTFLHDRLRQELHSSEPLALLLIDFNRFKEVNDTLGHHAGDLLLQQVGPRLRELLRPNDTVARLGGDEFAVLLPDINAAGAGAVARRVAALMSVPFPVDGHSLDMDASIGIALHPDHAQDGATLLQRADVAMYLAKRKGTGYALYDAEQDGHSPARLALMNDLRQALAQGQFVLHYQPIIDLQEDQVIGVEALLRWQHPSHGLVSPDQFIPLAEGSGAIIPLTLWALEEALRQCSAWQRQGLTLGIAVNLSTRALHDPRLPAAVGSLLRRYAIKPASLTLEITESCLMTDTARAMPILNRLDELGVRIAIDDFGTGYSSLAYLRHLPVDKLKIDKSFVLGLGVDATDAALVRSIVAMAHELSLSVIAEGVETATTWDILRTLGELEAQGHFISRPLPPEDLVRWLADSIWRCRGLSA